MKKIFLYGAGGYGKAVLNIFSDHKCEDMIVGVIDNNPGLKNGTLLGKKIIPYDEARPILNSEFTVILSVELELSMVISEQLKRDGIIRYVHWTCEQNNPFDEILAIIHEENDYAVFSHTLLQELSTVRSQKEYLLSHCSPTNMKPATGKLRERQLKLVEFADEINSILAKQSLYPFLTSGNLLGHVRHGGFIPWDDDFDFTIMRSEYEKMKEYLCGHFYYSKYGGPLNDDNAQYKWMKEQMNEHAEEMILLEKPMLFRAGKKMGEDYLLVDFFPFDEFGQPDQYNDRLNMLQKYNKKVISAKSVEECDSVIKTIGELDQTYRSNGGAYLGFGYDVKESYSGSRYNGFIKRDEVFPLKSIVYEGKRFLAPKSPEAFLRYEFGADYMKLPSSFGLHHSSEDIERV